VPFNYSFVVRHDVQRLDDVTAPTFMRSLNLRDRKLHRVKALRVAALTRNGDRFVRVESLLLEGYSAVIVLLERRLVLSDALRFSPLPVGWKRDVPQFWLHQGLTACNVGTTIVMRVGQLLEPQHKDTPLVKPDDSAK
jgi:hypothetical protein